MSDKLLSNHEKPYILQLKDAELIFSTCALDISFLLADDASCFNVEEVNPLRIYNKPKICERICKILIVFAWMIKLRSIIF